MTSRLAYALLRPDETVTDATQELVVRGLRRATVERLYTDADITPTPRPGLCAAIAASAGSPLLIAGFHRLAVSEGELEKLTMELVNQEVVLNVDGVVIAVANDQGCSLLDSYWSAILLDD